LCDTEPDAGTDLALFFIFLLDLVHQWAINSWWKSDIGNVSPPRKCFLFVVLGGTSKV